MSQVLIIGGGPAGLATAIAGRLAGLDVTVVDRAEPPIDKACGEGLMPDGLALLRKLGVQLDPDRMRLFHGIRYLDGDVVADGRFPGIAGAGIRRLHLHEALVRRAEDLGVRLRWKTRVLGLIEGGALTEDGPIKADWIVGADGLRSRVREWTGLEGRPTRVGRFGVRRHYALAPWSDVVEVYWADHCEAYVTPVSGDEVGVAFLWSTGPWSGRKVGFNELLRLFPALEERLRGVTETSRDRGIGPLRQRTRGVHRGRVALIGDASGYVDAITGEGLTLAFQQVPVLVDALVRGDLSHYGRRHRRLGLFANRLTELLLQVEKRPWLRRRVVRALARDPKLFSRILAVHSGAKPVRSLGIGSGPRLLWRLL